MQKYLEDYTNRVSPELDFESRQTYVQAFLKSRDVVISSVFWFVTYRYAIWPILIVLPVFAALGVILPLFCYRKAVKQTIVERLRESSE